jgi:DNA-binding transcriptional LysR family regulator
MRQLEIFLAVARAGSFRRAAERVHLSQPALSQHVGELERGLGTRLFERRGRAVTLTEAGRILEDHALRVRRRSTARSRPSPISPGVREARSSSARARRRASICCRC